MHLSRTGICDSRTGDKFCMALTFLKIQVHPGFVFSIHSLFSRFRHTKKRDSNLLDYLRHRSYAALQVNQNPNLYLGLIVLQRATFHLLDGTACEDRFRAYTHIHSYTHTHTRLLVGLVEIFATFSEQHQIHCLKSYRGSQVRHRYKSALINSNRFPFFA